MLHRWLIHVAQHDPFHTPGSSEQGISNKVIRICSLFYRNFLWTLLHYWPLVPLGMVLGMALYPQNNSENLGSSILGQIRPRGEQIYPTTMNLTIISTRRTEREQTTTFSPFEDLQT